MSKTTVFRYTIKSMGDSSTEYGNCECCGKPASEVYYQVEERQYQKPITNRVSWTQHRCNSLFGHQDCLIMRRQLEEVTA